MGRSAAEHVVVSVGATALISAIFPTRNRAGLLAGALESLTRQTLPRDAFEVIVVDNGSTDNTAAVVASFSERLANLRYSYARTPGLHVGRHQGMQEAGGDILVFADDDIEALPSWLETFRDVFEDPTVAMCGGNNIPLFLQPPPEWLQHLWDRSVVAGGRALAPLSLLQLDRGRHRFSPYFVWGCNFAVRKSVLRQAGGFHPDAMPGELIRYRGDGETHVSRFVLESGLGCVFDAGASVYHKVTPERMTFDYFRQRGFAQGVSDSFTALRNTSCPSRPWLSIARRMKGWARRTMTELRSDRQHAALSALREGHSEGYAFHQRAYRDDPDVRAWVHRPTYMEE